MKKGKKYSKLVTQYWPLILVFVLALSVRMFFLANNNPVSHDEAIYLNLAQNLKDSGEFQLDYMTMHVIEHDNLPIPAYLYQPIYPGLLSLLSLSDKVSIIKGRGVSILFGTLLTIISFFLGRILLDKKKSLFFSASIALLPFLAFSSAVANSDAVAYFLFTGFLLFFLMGFMNERQNYIIISGFFLAFAYLTRQDFIIFMPVFLLPVFIKCKNRIRIIGGIIFLIIFLLGTTILLSIPSKTYHDIISDPLNTAMVGVDDQTELLPGFVDKANKEFSLKEILLNFKETFASIIIITGIFSFTSLIGFYYLLRFNKKAFVTLLSIVLIHITFFSIYTPARETRYQFYIFLPLFLLTLFPLGRIPYKYCKIALVLLVLAFFLQYIPYYDIHNFNSSPEFGPYRVGTFEVKKFATSFNMPADTTIMSVNIEMCYYLDCKAVEPPYSNLSDSKRIIKTFDVTYIIFNKKKDPRVSEDLKRDFERAQEFKRKERGQFIIYTPR